MRVLIFVLLAACADARQRRALQCRFATLELEAAQRDMRSAMLAGTVKYVQLDRVEGAITTVNACVNEFTRE